MSKEEQRVRAAILCADDTVNLDAHAHDPAQRTALHGQDTHRVAFFRIQPFADCRSKRLLHHHP
ncbi:hypothetical protein [Paraburkholderia bannensis]|uniref:hypothetical protein n=1 Tax=Paraburkholderia bannensis TaxID=765414 RepID=UPI002ABE4DC2|nr:hypothetical protein [Paraburkholderia bannensis]